jgi:tetratricopeptide (TPR) repeat protein
VTGPNSIDPRELDRAIAAGIAGLDRTGAAGEYRLGRLLLLRHLLPGGRRDAGDRDRAIELFEAALASGDLPSTDGEIARLGAALLLMQRVMPLPDLPDLPAQPPSLAMLGLFTGISPDDSPQAKADLAAAIAHLRAATEGPVRHPELATVARMMLGGLLALQMGIDPAAAATSPGDLMTMLGGIVSTMSAADPARDPAAVLFGLLATDLSPEDSTEETADALRELKRLAPLLPAGEIRAVVHQQLGLALAGAVPGDGSTAEAVRHFSAALDELSPADEAYPDALRRLAGAVLTDAALRGDPGAVDRAIERADEVLALPVTDPVIRGKDLFLRAMAQTLLAQRDGDPDALLPAVEGLLQALTDVPAEDPLAPTIVGMLGALLNDRHLDGGVLEDAAAARQWMRKAAAVAHRHEQSGTLLGDVSPIIALDAVGRTAAAVRHGTPEELASATAELERALATLPPGFSGLWRPRIEAALALSHLARAVAAGEADGVRAAADELTAASGSSSAVPSAAPAMRSLAGAAELIRGLLDDDEAALVRAAGLLDAADGDVFGVSQQVGIRSARGLARLARHERYGRPADLDAGIADLERARETIGDRPGIAAAGTVLSRLADAYGMRADLANHPHAEIRTDADRADADRADADRADGGQAEAGQAAAGQTGAERAVVDQADMGRADVERAVRTGLAGLRARVGDVLLQADVDDALSVARGAAAESYRVARRCLDARRPRPDLAAQALELGRGLALRAAMWAGNVPGMLAAAGHADLAREWSDQPPGGAAQIAGLALNEVADLAGPLVGGGDTPPDLRRRVLAALSGPNGPDSLLEAPDPGVVGAALGAVGADALVYLGADLIVTVRADGSVTSQVAPGLDTPPLAPAEGGTATGKPADGDAATEEPTKGEGTTREPAEGDATTREPAEGDATTREPAYEDATTREFAGAGAGATAPARERADFGPLADWAWKTAVEPLFRVAETWQLDRPARLVLVPGGQLGEVPWHAARRPGPDRPHYACEDAVFSYAASAQQLVEVAARLPLPVTAAPAVLAEPGGDLPYAAREVAHLLDTVYPGSERVGGTAREVLDRLPARDHLGASMLHLGCHGRIGHRPADSRLELGGESLPVSAVLVQAYGRRPGVPGGLVVLASCRSDLAPGLSDEALTLSTAFLAAGAVGVIGSQWAVGDRATMYFMIMLHVFMLADGLPPADALRATQLWMLDPERRAPNLLPELIDGLNNPNELCDVAAWGAFRHHGR